MPSPFGNWGAGSVVVLVGSTSMMEDAIEKRDKKQCTYLKEKDLLSHRRFPQFKSIAGNRNFVRRVRTTVIVGMKQGRRPRMPLTIFQKKNWIQRCDGMRNDNIIEDEESSTLNSFLPWILDSCRVYCDDASQASYRGLEIRSRFIHALSFFKFESALRYFPVLPCTCTESIKIENDPPTSNI